MPKHSPSSDRHALYYQAIIQLRPADEKLVNYVLDYFKNKEHVTIAKIDKLKTGIDVYISDK
ncbi:MAG: NMD3-related protein, partial [Nanoarchaeota archaeon]